MKDRDKLQNLRHSCAHLLAAAVLELWPGTLRAIGPSIENGFYYDFEFNHPITEEDFPKIEKKMHEILKTWNKFERIEVSGNEAMKQFDDEPYKKKLIQEFSKEGQKLTLYKSGNYIDLCKGGHAENPAEEIGALKLLSLAGAYWRGDEKNKMLTRVYGTCFPSQKELDEYLHMLEEAKKRDHKKLGKELGLFVFSDLVGPGLPLWTPKGTLLRNLLDNYVWELRKARGYQKVTIPHITKKELYETSGHWDKFSEELFKIKTREGHTFAMKPMNCPHHTQIYASVMRSYRDLPQRYAETTMCYRDEQTGELSGLSRTRAFTQDDAHVFARKNQVKEEFNKIWDIVQTFYSAFGFSLNIRLSFHDPDNFKAYLGTPEMWQQAEKSIREIADERKIKYIEAKGEAAFYGPKIDFMAKDSLGRNWQVATIQLDINMPERFNLFCINEKGEEERIVMIHAAIMGSIERFLSILIEHYAGAFPLWLTPVQIVLLPIADRHNNYAIKVNNELLEQGIRSEIDFRSDRLQAKIRNATLQKVPFMGIIGDKEIANEAIAIRTRMGEDLGQIKLPQFLLKLKEDIDKKI
jgi:threonyl-tRNA synthetase